MPDTRAPRIQVLDKTTAELIAAGEVVERPASVVKELVENAVDALAAVVTVEITGGGVAMLRVSDNGCGICREDVPKAFLRHSTSKIRSGEDLGAIGTLGFRGEALASVAAVSRVELLTRAEEEDSGTRFLIEGGEPVLSEDAGRPVGTTVTVRDLFYNTPARMKFLKKDVSEGTAVAAVMDRVALSHPEISFRFIREGKETLLTPGDCKLLSAVYAVYGREFASSLIPVDYALGDVTVGGLVSKPSAARANRNMQHFYINDRYVRSRTLMAALEAACKGSVMAGKFPSCVLSVGIPFDRVDVNVHPAKLEVRFSDERPVFDAVYYAVKSALAEKDTRPELHLKKAPAARLPEAQPPARQMFFGAGEPQAPESAPAAAPFSREDAPLMAAEYTFARYTSEQDAPVRIAPLVEPPEPPAKEPLDLPAENAFLSARAADAEVSGELHAEPAAVSFLGEAFKTYAVLEVPDGLLFIDKHAAHERILYNRLKENAGADTQLLLSPVAVTLPKEEYGALTENLGLAKDAGFEIEDFGGGTVLVRSVPALLAGEDIAAITAQIAGGLILDTRAAQPQRLEGILHSVACRAAVKAGGRSDQSELLALAREIFASGEVRYCPHGRPVAFLLSRREIEKQFGRIS